MPRKRLLPDGSGFEASQMGGYFTDNGPGSITRTFQADVFSVADVDIAIQKNPLSNLPIPQPDMLRSTPERNFPRYHNDFKRGIHPAFSKKGGPSQSLHLLKEAFA